MSFSESSSEQKIQPIRTSHSEKPASRHEPDSPDDNADADKHVKRRGRARPKRYGHDLTQMTSRFRASTFSGTRTRQSSVADTFTSKSLPPSVPSTIGGIGGLDPFLPLPQPLSPYDRSLLQFYLTQLPTHWYGANSQPAFSVVRDVSLPLGVGSEVYLGWMLMAAENALLERRTEEKEALLASRRAKNYKMMRQLLEDPRNHRLSSTLVAMVVAGSAESRLGAFTAAQGHFNAILRLLQERQGLRTIQRLEGAHGMALSHVLHMSGLSGLFDSNLHVAQRLGTYEALLRSFHAWNLQIRGPMWPAESVSVQNRKPYPEGTADLSLPSTPNYWPTRRHCIGSSSILGRFLNPQTVETSLSAQRCRAASLYTLTSTLYNLRRDETRALAFLLDLDYTVRESYESYGTLQPLVSTDDALSVNRHAALVSMLAHCARRLGIWTDSAENEKEMPALRTWESLEFVELIMLASPGQRQSVLGMLWLWLTLDGAEASYERLMQLGGMELEGMRTDIVENWIKNHGGMRPS